MASDPAPRESSGDDPTGEELPPRLVAVAFVLALVCTLLPLAVLGAGFAGAVLIRRGRPVAGTGVLALAVLCSVLGVILLR